MIALFVLRPESHGGIQTTSETYLGLLIEVNPAVGSEVGFTAICPPVLSEAVYRGRVSQIDGDSIHDPDATWQDHEFSAATKAAQVEFDSGYSLMILDCLAAEKRLIVQGQLPAGVSVGERYRIRPHLTLNRLFGAANSFGLQAGVTADSADNIVVYQAQSNKTHIIYRSTEAGGRWSSESVPDIGQLSLRPGEGFLVRRRSLLPLRFQIAGELPRFPAALEIAPGANLVGFLHSPGGRALKDIDMANPAQSEIGKGRSLTEADQILFTNPNGSTTAFFLSSIEGNPGWFDTAYQPSSERLVPSGTAFFFIRQERLGGFSLRLQPPNVP